LPQPPGWGGAIVRPATMEASPEQATRTSRAWLMVVAERNLPEINTLVAQRIKVPPLRVRKADIEAQVNYYLAMQCKRRSQPRPRLTPEALRSLQGYDFPGNLAELDSLIKRALSQREDNSSLSEDVFWSLGKKQQRFRLNLLNAYPVLRQFLRNPGWPDRLNYGVTLPVYTAVVALLFFGPQTRDQNFALNLFWAWWWPLILLSFPFVGRLWCSVCPFMIYGEVTQWVSAKLLAQLDRVGLKPRSLLPWPRKWADRWGGWILFAGFAVILLWEELWQLENTAYLSAWLLVIITAGAMVCSALFERRFWCRYLCPIGGMNGLFAKLSMTELRAQQGICAASCTTYQCYKGGPALGEGQETNGCPLYSHPAQLTDNRNCVLCMTCLQACPHRSVAVNLRPPGIELWTSHQPLSYEVALLFLLLGAVPLHHLPGLVQALGQSPEMLDVFWVHVAWSVVALGSPGAIALLAQGLIQLLPRLLKTLQPNLCRPRSFVQLAYGYLPLVLGANLAHYLHLGLAEAGLLWPVTLATLGLSRTATTWVWIADPAVISFLQGTTLLLALLLTMVLTQKIAKQRWFQLLPQHGSAIALTLGLWQLIL
jgi:polyferredoxin